MVLPTVNLQKMMHVVSVHSVDTEIHPLKEKFPYLLHVQILAHLVDSVDKAEKSSKILLVIYAKVETIVTVL